MNVLNGLVKILCIALLSFSIYNFIEISSLITPVSLDTERARIVTELREEYKVSERLALAIYNAHIVYGFDHKFIAELMQSESGFDPNAISPKGYKGLMQTPSKTGYTTVDVMHGTAILKEKFSLYKNPLDAVAAYKGGKNVPLARQQAKQMLDNYARSGR